MLQPPPVAWGTELLWEAFPLWETRCRRFLPLLSRRRAKLFLQKMWASPVHSTLTSTGREKKNEARLVSTDLLGCVTPDDLFCAELLVCPVDWSPLAVGEMRDLPCYTLNSQFLQLFLWKKYIKQQKSLSLEELLCAFHWLSATPPAYQVSELPKRAKNKIILGIANCFLPCMGLAGLDHFCRVVFTDKDSLDGNTVWLNRTVFLLAGTGWEWFITNRKNLVSQKCISRKRSISTRRARSYCATLGW